MILRPSTLNHSVLFAVVAALIVAFQASSGEAQEIDNAPARAFNAAAALQNAGLHSRAMAKWTDFIAKYPNDERIGRAHYYMGVCQLRNKKFSDAARTFETVLARWPKIDGADKAQYNLAMSRYEIATAAKNADGFRGAAKDFATVASKYNKSEFVDEALYYQGDSLFNAGDLAGAVSAYQNLIKEHASSPQAARGYYDLGVAFQELDKNPEAATTFQTFLEKPEYKTHELAPEIRLRWAICLRDNGDLDKAAEQFNAVSQISAFELAPYAALRFGQTKLEQEKYQEAAKSLGLFSKTYPKSEYRDEALKTAGQCYYLSNKPQDAIRVLQQVAHGNDPAAAEAAYWLGRSQIKIKQAAQALKTVEGAIGRFGNHPFLPYLKFARIDALYEIPARRAETPALYESFAREHPDHKLAPQASYMAAFSSFGQQQYGKAREIGSAFLADDQKSSSEFAGDMRYIAAESQLLEKPDDVGARGKAESLFRELVSKHPDHSRVSRCHLRIGWCLQASDKLQESINYLREMIAKFEKQEQLPEALLLIGRSHSKLKQHAEAIKAFSEAIAANGKWEKLDQLLIGKAQCHRELDQADPAAESLRQLVGNLPNSDLRPQALYWLGEISQQRSKHDEAANYFKEVAEKHQQSEFAGPAMHALAAVLFAKGDYPQTRQWASRLVDGNANDELKRRGHYLRGIAFHREKNYGAAISDLQTYRANPADQEEASGAAYVLALCHIQEKQFDAAKDALTDLLKSKPEFSTADQAYYELGHALREQDDKRSEAAAAFEWIVSQRPESKFAGESWFRLAQHHIDVSNTVADEAKQASLAKAAESLTSGLAKKLEPGLKENMQYLLGDLQMRQQRFDDAATTLIKQVVEFPAGKYVGPATFLAAQARYELRQFDQALPLFLKVGGVSFAETSAEQIESYRSQAAYRAGDCAAKLNQWQASQQHFQSVIDKFPKFAQRAEARYGVAFALQQQNQLDPAIAAYEQVTSETETETAAKARFMVGEIEFGRKRYENAIEQFLVVTVGYAYPSWQALARFETARCFRELGDKTRAIKTLREMIAAHPEHARTADAKKLLDELNQ